MATNVAIDEKLLAEAMKIGKHRTKKATVEEALREFVDRRKQRLILGDFGTIDYDTGYDYKKQRARK
jgi:Arc/MetJ family transcription regulator